jgi:hypothetical protein
LTVTDYERTLIVPPAKGDVLARDDLIEMEGKVVEILVGGNFRITIQGGHSVLAHLAGTDAAQSNPRGARRLCDRRRFAL